MGPPAEQAPVTGIPQLHETILATTRYLAALTDLTDADCRRPSALPGWTRGHVITHLARNADGLSRLLRWAQTGVPTPMYESDEQRNADIDAGAGRTAEELRQDSAAACGRFLQAANELHSSHLEAPVSRTLDSPSFPASKVAGMRRTEVEVHHADLLIGYTPYDWPADFTAHVLDRRRRELETRGIAMRWRLTDTGRTIEVGSGGPEVTGHSADLAWWLLGREAGEGLVCSEGRLPDIGRWL